MKKRTLLSKDFIKKNQKTRLYNVETPIIGLTGGIGTGKSTVCDLLENKGLFIIKADQLVAQAYQLEKVQDQILSVSGLSSLDKNEIRNWAFSSEKNLKKLENIIHPELKNLFCKKTQALDNTSPIIYEIPLLFEKNLQDKFDFIVSVIAQQKIQIERVMKRQNLSKKEVERIISTQTSSKEKAKKSDFVISNNSTILDLEKSINHFLSSFFEIIS